MAVNNNSRAWMPLRDRSAQPKIEAVGVCVIFATGEG